MKKILFCVTYQDYSLPFFLSEKIRKRISPDFLLYESSDNYMLNFLQNNDFDYIYLRNPFTDENFKDFSKIKNKLNIILKNKKNAYIIDNIRQTEDIFFEDKWKQYGIFKKFMPITNTFVNEAKNTDFSSNLLKEKISSRGKGVFFTMPENINSTDYIIQKKINIDKEFRVYLIFNEIINKVEVKLSKTENTKFKVLHVEPINKKLLEFSKEINKKINFDFVGLDIARDNKGKYYLIEINMSCLFGAFYRETKINLAEKFIQKLLENKQ